MGNQERPKYLPDAHAEQMRIEARASRRMAEFARGLGHRDVGDVAEMIGYYRDEAAKRSLDRGRFILPDTGQYDEELASFAVPPDKGAKIIFAVDALHKVLSPTTNDSQELTPPDFQRVRGETDPRYRGTADRVYSFASLPPEDPRITHLLHAIHALTGLDRNAMNIPPGNYYQENAISPLGVEISESKMLHKIFIYANPRQRPTIRA